MVKWLLGIYGQMVDQHDDEIRSLKRENRDLRTQLESSERAVEELQRLVIHHRHLAELDKDYLKLLIDTQIRKAQKGYPLDHSFFERL